MVRARAMRWSRLWLLVSMLMGCTRFGPVYPSRPPDRPSPLVADPAPSKVNVHVAISSIGLRGALEQAVPITGDGSFSLLGSDRRFSWIRVPLDVSFGSGKIVVKTIVAAHVDLPISAVDVPFEVTISSEPVINTDYALKLQAVEVSVTSDDRRLKVADQLADVFARIGDELTAKVKGFSYELKPMLEEAYARVGKPIELPLDQASGCAELRVLGVEAAPLILADGVEKDFALVVAPSVTIPCTPQGPVSKLPPLSNVASLPTGPFTVTIPVVASYAELTRALGATFTDGKLFFSKEHPKLYLEKPQVYESAGMLVLQLHIAGPVHELGIDAEINGDLYLVGHPTLIDNEIALPDLEPTIETSNFLLSLKAMTDGERIKAEARKALRLDLTQQLHAVQQKLSSELTFGSAEQCLVGNVDKLELTELHTHESYLRVNVVVTARASASLPCSSPLQPVTPPVTPAQ
jgi:hypothetical protein